MIVAVGGQAAQVLLVEGVDDKHVVRHLRDKLAPDVEFCCEAYGGKDALLDAMPVVLKHPSRRAVGVLMDADEDIDARWQALKDLLRGTTIALASEPQPGGFLVRGDPNVHLNPSFGVWLMPDNEHAGELEDFVIQLLPEGDPVCRLPISSSTAFRNNIGSSGHRRKAAPSFTRGWQLDENP